MLTLAKNNNFLFVLDLDMELHVPQFDTIFQQNLNIVTSKGKVGMSKKVVYEKNVSQSLPSHNFGSQNRLFFNCYRVTNLYF